MTNVLIFLRMPPAHVSMVSIVCLFVSVHAAIPTARPSNHHIPPHQCELPFRETKSGDGSVGRTGAFDTTSPATHTQSQARRTSAPESMVKGQRPPRESGERDGIELCLLWSRGFLAFLFLGETSGLRKPTSRAQGN